MIYLITPWEGTIIERNWLEHTLVGRVSVEISMTAISGIILARLYSTDNDSKV